MDCSLGAADFLPPVSQPAPNPTFCARPSPVRPGPRCPNRGKEACARLSPPVRASPIAWLTGAPLLRALYRAVAMASSQEPPLPMRSSGEVPPCRRPGLSPTRHGHLLLCVLPFCAAGQQESRPSPCSCWSCPLRVIKSTMDDPFLLVVLLAEERREMPIATLIPSFRDLLWSCFL